MSPRWIEPARIEPVDLSDLSFKRRQEIPEVPEWKVRDKTISENVSGSLHSVAQFWGPVVTTDFLIGVSLMLVMHPITSTIPGGILTGLAIWAVAIRRRARLHQKFATLWLWLTIAVYGFLIWSSYLNGMPFTQRVLKFVIFSGIAYAIASARMDVRSLVMGGMAGGLLNVPAFYAGLTPNNYPPYLTGFYGDKNVAGMYYALWGVLGLMVLRRRWTKALWLVVSVGLLFLTGSRTSMFGFGLALIWLLIRNRANITGRLVAVALGILATGPLQAKFAENSLYGDRSGTDWFRQQIDTAMAEKAAATPWYGLGLNQGTVTLEGGRKIWFHNSYLQTFVEGGWVFVGFVIVAFGIIGFGLFQKQVKIPPQMVIAQGGIIVVLACAWKLGEVFMTAGAFTVLGICLAFTYGERLPDTPEEDEGLTDAYLGLREARIEAERKRRLESGFGVKMD